MSLAHFTLLLPQVCLANKRNSNTDLVVICFVLLLPGGIISKLMTFSELPYHFTKTWNSYFELPSGRKMYKENI